MPAEIKNVFLLGWRLLLSPRKTLPEAISSTKSTLWMIPVLFIYDVTTELQTGESWLADLFEVDGSLSVLIGSLLWALLLYFLVFRVLDLFARFLGGPSRHDEFRWIYFLLTIPLACFSCLFLLLDRTGLVGFSPMIKATYLSFEAILGFWCFGVTLYGAAKLYDFSMGRVFVMLILPVALFFVLCLASAFAILSVV